MAVVKKGSAKLRELYEKAYRRNSSGEAIVNRLEPKEERLMLKDPQWAYLYAKYVLTGPWPEDDEKVFFNDPKWAYLYSIFVSPSENIRRQMIALAIKDTENEWAKKYFDAYSGVDGIRKELELLGKI